MELALIKQQDHYINYLIRNERFSGGLAEKVTALERSLVLLSHIQGKDMDIYRQEHTDMKKSIKEDIAKESALLDTRMQREMNDRINPVSKGLDKLSDKFYEHLKEK